MANVADEIDKVGAHLKVLKQGVDTSNAAGRAFFGMLTVFAVFEPDVRRERQAEAIAKAKCTGLYKGRKRSIDPTEVRALKRAGRGVSEIASPLRISRQNVYRA